MEYKVEEFRNVAAVNKSKLRNKSVIIPIADNKYQFKISGIGPQAVKLENYFSYSEIINQVQEGNNEGLEYLIEQIIIDPNQVKSPILEDPSELKLRANANKESLRRMSVEAFVGTKKYDFRIAGVGGRAIKLEIYVGYVDIANELNEGNKINLEFIISEILVGNQVDYSLFENIDIEEYSEDEVNTDEKESDEETDIINKLSPDESEKLISQIQGVQKLIFDSINDIEEDIFTIEDVLDQDLIKAYAVQGKSFEPIIIENINEFIELGLISINNNKYYKLW